VSWQLVLLGWNARLRGPDPRLEELSWIGNERIAIGGVVTPATVFRLSERGVSHIVNCRSIGQVRLARDLAIERAIFGEDRVAHASLRDFGHRQNHRRWAPAAIFAAQALEDPDAKVLIHCQKGKHRSVMVAYAVLRLRGYSAAESAALILDHRRGAELLSAYVESVERWLDDRQQAVDPQTLGEGSRKERTGEGTSSAAPMTPPAAAIHSVGRTPSEAPAAPPSSAPTGLVP
jgi:hypothetical protein